MQSSFAHERGFAQTRSALAEDAANPGRAPDYAPLVADLRQAFLSGKTKSYEWRVRELQQMRRMLVESEAKILAAVKKDLNKHPVEAFQAEVGLIVSDIDLALANLRTWMADESVSHPLLAQPGSSKYVKQPKGVALIIGAWNYPFQLSLLPLVSAVAAGCAAVLKPSELAVESARVMEEMVHQYMDKSLYRVVQGGVPETTALLKERYDHVFYTGNGAVGRVVYQAAAKHLTPVTLELGGKSPAYVAPDAKLDVVVKRLIGTKFFNMGQTCIAPDYVLVHASIKERFVQAAVKTVKEFWGEDPSKSTSYGRIINERHFDRVKSMIDEQHGGKVVCGGSANAKREARFIPPTIVLDPSLASRLMSEEIFGPVLPVVTVESLDQALAVINDREPSLASYVFSESKDTADKFITNIVSGGTCVNDALYHAVNPALKFGGVGASGLGAYHGKAGFDEFTHARPVMFRDTWLDNAQRYPPLKEEGLDMLRRILVGPLFPEHVVRGAKVAAGLGLVAAVALRGRL